MENNYNLTAIPYDGQLLMPLPNGDEQQHLQELQPANMNAASSIHFDTSAAANTHPHTHPHPHQMTSDFSGTDHPLGSFFGESPHLEVLSAHYVQASQILHEEQRPVAQEPEQQTVSEVLNVQSEIAVPGELVENEPLADDQEEGGEEEEAEEDDEEPSQEEEEIIPDNGGETGKSEEGKGDVNEQVAPTEPSTIVKDETPLTEEVHTDNEEPASSSHTSRRKEEEVDENQCRVCCATRKEDLVTLFKKVEEQTVAEMLMIICPTVYIAIKDFLPQFICNTCLDNVVKAIQLKHQCETTEKELRKKLSRHKNKIRRPAGYVVIDATLDSDPASDDEPTNDEEFKVSDIASATPSEDSESSESSDSKKKKTKSRKRRKSSATTLAVKSKSKSGKSANGSSDDEDDGDPIGNHKRKRSSNSSPETYACDECDHIFLRKQSLILHRKAHTNDREPIACKVCGRKFKIKSAYRAHMEKHREEKALNKCHKCSRIFSSNGDLKRHLAEDHNQPGVLLECNKCKRTFVSSSRLQSHKKQGRCPGFERGKNKKGDIEAFVVGRDLFKTVAPLTTTYWSDSYSD